MSNVNDLVNELMSHPSFNGIILYHEEPVEKSPLKIRMSKGLVVSDALTALRAALMIFVKPFPLAFLTIFPELGSLVPAKDDEEREFDDFLDDNGDDDDLNGIDLLGDGS